MKKTIFTILFSLFMLLLMSVVCFADTADDYVFDYAQILTDNEHQKLDKKASDIALEYGFNVYMMIFSDLRNTGDITDVSKQIYSEQDLGHGNSVNSIILSLDVSQRDYYLYAEGETAEQLMTGDNIGYMEDRFLSYFSENRWYQGFDAYLSAADDVLESTYSGAALTRREVKDSRSILPGYAFAGIAGLVIAFAVTNSMKSQMKSAKKAVVARSYLSDGEDGVKILNRSDRFSHVTRSERIIQTRTQGPAAGGPGGIRGGSPGGSSGGSGRGKF